VVTVFGDLLFFIAAAFLKKGGHCVE